MSRYLPDFGYTSPQWAKGCDRAALLASARKEYPCASEAQIEGLAKAGSELDALFTPTRRPATVDGQLVSPAEADEFRRLGKAA